MYLQGPAPKSHFAPRSRQTSQPIALELSSFASFMTVPWTDVSSVRFRLVMKNSEGFGPEAQLQAQLPIHDVVCRLSCEIRQGGQAMAGRSSVRYRVTEVGHAAARDRRSNKFGSKHD